MAKDKKSVLLYCDLIHTIEKMDNETAGKFFKHYLRYINDLNPETDNLVVDLTFESVKQNLKRDLKKWENTLEAKSISGQEGNLKRWNRDLYDKYKAGELTLKESQSIAKSRTAIKSVANVAVTDNVTVTVKDKDINNTEEFDLFWNMYAKKTGRDKCLKAFLKLSDVHKQKIFSTLPNYIESTPDVKFRKNPLTYLNGKHWEDEIETINKNTNQAKVYDPIVELARKAQSYVDTKKG